MDWSEEQVEILTAAGIRPETLCLPAEARFDLAEVSCTEAVFDLGDTDFAKLEPFLPQEPRQAGAISNKEVLDALLWVQQTRKKLTRLPSRYGTAEAVRKRAERWAIAGVWDYILAGLERADLSPVQRDAIRKIAIQNARRGERINKDRSSSA